MKSVHICSAEASSILRVELARRIARLAASRYCQRRCSAVANAAAAGAAAAASGAALRASTAPLLLLLPLLLLQLLLPLLLPRPCGFAALRCAHALRVIVLASGTPASLAHRTAGTRCAPQPISLMSCNGSSLATSAARIALRASSCTLQSVKLARTPPTCLLCAARVLRALHMKRVARVRVLSEFLRTACVLVIADAPRGSARAC